MNTHKQTLTIIDKALERRDNTNAKLFKYLNSYSLAFNEPFSSAGPRRQIPVHDILNEGFLEIGECAITQDETFSRLHSHQCAWYGDRLVCISA